jgi:hypothetical protein
VYQLCVEAAGSIRWGVAVAFLPAFSLAVFGSVRPQIFSFALLSLVYWIMESSRQRRRQLLWALPVVVALWVNLHGAFVLGLAVIALYLGCEAARRLVRGPAGDTLSLGELGKWSGALGAAVLATLLNPQTYQVYGFVGDLQANRAVQAFVIEWQPPQLKEREGLLVFYGPFFLALLVLLPARARLGLTELVLFLGFTAFALLSVRNGVWFVLTVAPLVARALPTLDWRSWGESLRRFRWVETAVNWAASRTSGTATPPRYGLNATLAALLLALTILVSPWVYPHLGSKALGGSLVERNTPVGAMEYIKQHHLRGHIFHPQIYGDYLVWCLHDQGQRSFIDGRTHLFDEALVRDYLEVFVDVHWEERLARYDIRYLLLSKQEGDNQKLMRAARASRHWRVLYEDALSVLFEKVS